MSLTPIAISQLPIAPLPVLQTDTVILSRGVNQDYQTTMNAIWQINMSIFPSTPTSLLATDLFMFSRAGTLYTTPFSGIGFVAGTVCWFYQATPPAGWALVSVPNDSILGVKDSLGVGLYVNAGTQLNGYTTSLTQNTPAGMGTGTWNMTADQMAQHQHGVNTTRSGIGSTSGAGIATSAIAGTPSNAQGRFSTGGSTVRYNTQTGDVLIQYQNTGSNLIGTWRPTTSIGILCSKL